jgi:hypothetical protein
MTLKPPTTATRLAAIERDAAETRAKLEGLHDALMTRQPGEEHSLLERMAIVTHGIESGRNAGRILIWIAGVLAAIAAISTATAARLHIGGTQ